MDSPPRHMIPAQLEPPTSSGALPHLDLVCSMTLIENSSLRTLLLAEVEELDTQFVEGRSSPMFHGNAMALLFEAAMDDEIERPHLMDLAEAIYYGGGDDDDDDAEEDDQQEEMAEDVDDSSAQRSSRRAKINDYKGMQQQQLADDYASYDDQEQDSRYHSHQATGTSPMRRDPYEDDDDEDEYDDDQDDHYYYGDEEPVPRRAQTSQDHRRGDAGNEDPLMKFWRATTATPDVSSPYSNTRQATPATRPATRQDLATRGTMRSRGSTPGGAFGDLPPLRKDKRSASSTSLLPTPGGVGGGKKKKTKRKVGASPQERYKHFKKTPHPLSTPPKTGNTTFSSTTSKRSRGGGNTTSTSLVFHNTANNTERNNSMVVAGAADGGDEPLMMSTRTGKVLPKMAEQSLVARGRLETAKQENDFWVNRLKMLQRELDKAQSRVDATRNKDTKFEVTTVVNETVNAQLAEERKRDFALRLEKAQAIRAHKAAHREAVRQAHSQTIQNKAEAGRLMKVHQRNHQAIMESIKQREYDEKCARRAEVQQVKVVSMLKRLREKAMRHEEIRRNYALKVEHVKQEERRLQEQSMQAVEETSKLVNKIRKLRELEASTGTSKFALKSLDTQLYQEEH